MRVTLFVFSIFSYAGFPLLCKGVHKVSVEEDRLVITGDHIDVVEITRSIRKKFRLANIISVGPTGG